MKDFVPRFTAPARDDPNVVSVQKGGHNHAYCFPTGLCMPNCCGYVHFRVLDMGFTALEAKLCRNDACAYFGFARDGLTRSQIPTLGAIICWSSTGKNKRGHVGIVEEIYSNGDIICSMSDLSGAWFYTKRFYKKDNYKYPSTVSNYTTQGFIAMPFDNKVGSPVSRDKNRHQIEITYASLRARKRPEINPEVVLGYINMGIYNVLDTRDLTYEPSNGYKWYKVEEDMWVAYIEGCVNDLPAETPAGDELERLRAENAEMKNDIISLELTVDKLRDTIDKIRDMARYN